jgi:hypothetical protein
LKIDGKKFTQRQRGTARREDMPDGRRKRNFEPFEIRRKTYFDIKMKLFMLKYR